MGELKGTYRGYEIWYYEKDEKTNQPVWVAISKGKRPDIQEYRKNQKGIKNLINDTINKPPEKVGTYKGVDIEYNPKTGDYEAKVGSRKRKSDEREELHDWIDKQKK